MRQRAAWPRHRFYRHRHRRLPGLRVPDRGQHPTAQERLNDHEAARRDFSGGDRPMTGTRIQLRIARWLSGLLPLAVMCGFTLASARVEAQAGGVMGSGAAAVVTTTTGAQQFASVGLPSAGGMADSELASVAVPSTLSADGLVSITTGQLDQTLVSTTTTAEAANVSVLNGLITARAVLAVATSYANGVGATSESDGSTLVGLVVGGLNYGDVSPAP